MCSFAILFYSAGKIFKWIISHDFVVNFEHSLASESDVNSLFNFLFHDGYDVIKGNFTTV